MGIVPLKMKAKDCSVTLFYFCLYIQTLFSCGLINGWLHLYIC